MIPWWQSLSSRERTLSWLGGLAILSTVLFFGVFDPLDRQQQRLKVQVSAEQKVLDQLQTLATNATRLRGPQTGGGHIASGETLLAVLNATAASHNLDEQIKRVVPNGTEEASIAFDEIAFDQLISWLIALREQHGVEIARIVIDKASAPGQVNANLTLATAL